MAQADEKVRVYTIGHSTRAIEEFTVLLEAYAIQRLVDVRSIPRSRHNPQFNADNLSRSLEPRGIGWEHRKGLGGLRHTTKDSPNQGWRNASFRGYADYMQTEEFSREIKALADLARGERVAVMCAEAVPWRCHRSLIADALLVRGLTVNHIMGETNAREHVLTRFASVDGTHITYPFALDGGSGGE
jgi:uncharacterized protein (DUF488 family)